MTETPCPSWCTIAGPHGILHHAVVAHLPSAAVVMVSAAPDRPAEVNIVVGVGGAGVAPGITPLAARTLGQALIARGRDAEFGEALVAAADLIEGVAQSDGGEA